MVVVPMVDTVLGIQPPFLFRLETVKQDEVIAELRADDNRTRKNVVH